MVTEEVPCPPEVFVEEDLVAGMESVLEGFAGVVCEWEV